MRPQRSARVPVLAAVLMAGVLAAGCASGAPGAGDAGRATGGVVAGRIVSGPTCPVEHASSPCPPRPVGGATVQLLSGTHVVAGTTSDAAGRYRLSAAAGSYVVRVYSAAVLQHSAERTVRVEAGTTTTVDVELDSGLR